MVICLFGVRYKLGRDVELEKGLDARLLPVLREFDGFISFHLYSAENGEALGVIRFDSRQALEAWRNDATHRSVWMHAPDLYEYFWIQNSETYTEYGWSPDVGHTNEDLRKRFRDEESNRARPSV
jgi:heme-degrading monooxygenase HmoA